MSRPALLLVLSVGIDEGLARGRLAQALAVREETGVRQVGLCGGVFQSRRFGERATDLLAERGFEVHLPRELPANDAAIAFGLLVEYAGGSPPALPWGLSQQAG